MTNALDQLWDAEYRARKARNDFWGLADELVGQGLLRVEDVSECWGVAPDTARKRMKQWRDRVLEIVPDELKHHYAQYSYPERNDR